MPWKSSAMARLTAIGFLACVACRNCFCCSMSSRSKAETGLGVCERATVTLTRTAADNRRMRCMIASYEKRFYPVTSVVLTKALTTEVTGEHRETQGTSKAKTLKLKAEN